MTDGFEYTATPLKVRNRVTDLVAAVVVTAAISPALALPAGLAWRAFRWAAGL